MTNGLKKEDSAALKGLAVLLLIFHHCYRLADRIERYQVDLCGLTTEQMLTWRVLIPSSSAVSFSCFPMMK